MGNARCLSSSLLGVMGLVLVLGLLSSCRSPQATDATGSAPSVQLTISAAASLRNALEEIEAVYQSDTQSDDRAIRITYNFGASGALAQQIIQGAPVDVFLSASPDWMDVLERQQLLKGAWVDLVQNSLVLVVPTSSVAAEAVTINSFQDLRLARVKRVAMGEPKSVPAGRYAEEALRAMDLLDTLQQRLVFGKSVGQVLTYVETGAVDAGFVYLTDAQASKRVNIVAEASEGIHSPIVYSVSAIAASDQSALDFVAFLTSDAAMAIFQQHGFARIR